MEEFSERAQSSTALGKGGSGTAGLGWQARTCQEGRLSKPTKHKMSRSMSFLRSSAMACENRIVCAAFRIAHLCDALLQRLQVLLARHHADAHKGWR